MPFDRVKCVYDLLFVTQPSAHRYERYPLYPHSSYSLWRERELFHGQNKVEAIPLPHFAILPSNSCTELQLFPTTLPFPALFVPMQAGSEEYVYFCYYVSYRF